MLQQTYLVGVDGSPASRGAMRWTSEHAARTDEVVAAYIVTHAEESFGRSPPIGTAPLVQDPTEHLSADWISTAPDGREIRCAIREAVSVASHAVEARSRQMHRSRRLTAGRSSGDDMLRIARNKGQKVVVADDVAPGAADLDETGAIPLVRRVEGRSFDRLL